LAIRAALEKAFEGARTKRPISTAPFAAAGPFPLPKGRIGTGAGGNPMDSAPTPLGSLAHGRQIPQREQPESPDPHPHNLRFPQKKFRNAYRKF